MKRRHETPFGAKVLEGGAVEFRLWSPAAGKVEVETGGLHLPLERNAQTGVHVLATDLAKPNDLYRYRINGEHEVPDPASRFQPEDVHGPSMVVNPEAFDWRDED